MSQNLINFKSINMFFLAGSGIEVKLVEKSPTQVIWVDNWDQFEQPLLYMGMIFWCTTGREAWTPKCIKKIEKGESLIWHSPDDKWQDWCAHISHLPSKLLQIIRYECRASQLNQLIVQGSLKTELRGAITQRGAITATAILYFQNQGKT